MTNIAKLMEAQYIGEGHSYVEPPCACKSLVSWWNVRIPVDEILLPWGALTHINEKITLAECLACKAVWEAEGK